MTSIYQRNSSTLKMTCKIYIGYVRHCDDANQKKKRKKKGKVYSLYLNLLKIPNVNLQIGTSSLTHMIFVHILQTFFSFFSRFRKKKKLWVFRRLWAPYLYLEFTHAGPYFLSAKFLCICFIFYPSYSQLHDHSLRYLSILINSW